MKTTHIIDYKLLQGYGFKANIFSESNEIKVAIGYYIENDSIVLHKVPHSKYSSVWAIVNTSIGKTIFRGIIKGPEELEVILDAVLI